MALTCRSPVLLRTEPGEVTFARVFAVVCSATYSYPYY